jgi:hypothetical protein
MLLTRGRILECNWDKSLKSFPPCYSQSPLLMDIPPAPHTGKSGLKLVCNVNIIYAWKPQLSRLCPETSTKLYVHEFDFRFARIFSINTVVLRSFDNPVNIVQKTEVVRLVSMFYLAFLIRRPA